MSYRTIIPEFTSMHDQDDAAEPQSAAETPADHTTPVTKPVSGCASMQHLRECAELAFSHATDSQPYP